MLSFRDSASYIVLLLGEAEIDQLVALNKTRITGLSGSSYFIKMF